MMRHLLSLPLRLSLLSLGSLLLVSCDDADDDSKGRAARFTTSTKAAPNPQRDSLESLLRDDTLPSPDSETGAQFDLYSEYQGEDVGQVTGVSGRSLLLCFTSPWCEHSLAMKKSLKQLAQSEQGRVQVVIVDADKYLNLAERYELSKVPTTLLYVEGVRLRRLEGAHTRAEMQDFLRKTLSMDNASTK